MTSTPDDQEWPYWLVKDGHPRICIGPFEGPGAEEESYRFRSVHLSNTGFYITRQQPPLVFAPGQVEYVKSNLL